MNLLEHYIEEIYSETEVTEQFKERIGHEPHERIFLLDMRVNCYGTEERVKKRFFETELNEMREKGYYMA